MMICAWMTCACDAFPKNPNWIQTRTVRPEHTGQPLQVLKAVAPGDKLVVLDERGREVGSVCCTCAHLMHTLRHWCLRLLCAASFRLPHWAPAHSQYCNNSASALTPRESMQADLPPSALPWLSHACITTCLHHQQRQQRSNASIVDSRTKPKTPTQMRSEDMARLIAAAGDDGSQALVFCIGGV